MRCFQDKFLAVKLAAYLGTAIVAISADCALAQSVGTESQIDIRSTDLNSALRELARQTRTEILFQQAVIGSHPVSPLQGNFSVEAALGQLLKDSGLTARKTQRGSFIIERSSGESEAGSAAATYESADIVVTANKREERLQDIAMSVAALGEKMLERTGTVDLVDYATRIPNLSFGATGSALNLYTPQIRGVAGDGTTGFYIDDVPVPESMNPRVMELARIEVLRGPQGSLYGARSMGGTIRLITKRADPTVTEFKAHATLGAVAEGGLDYAVDSAFNVPISSNVAFRGNVYYQRQTGVHEILVDNPNIAGDETTHKNADDGVYWGLQAMVTWKPTERLMVEPRFMYQNAHLDWLPYSDLRPGNFTAKRVIDRADPNDKEWSISSLTITWDTDWGRFTSATALFNQNDNGREEFSEFINFAAGIPISQGGLGADPDGTPSYYPSGGSFFTANTKSRQITEEARFTSEFNGNFQLTAGIFYSKSKIDTLAPCSFAEGLNEATGNLFDTECVYSADFRTRIEESAVFGELEYAVLDNLFLTAGGRYFSNTFRRSVLEGGFFSPSPLRRSGKQSESGFNPKLALKWDVTNDWTLFGSAAKGYRIGGANLSSVPADFCDADLAELGLSAAPETFDSDSLWSYEIGSKSTHANGGLSLNVSAYFIKWSDIIQTTRLACGFGFTNNTGTAEVKGTEVEIIGNLENFHYSIGIGYTDAKITDPEDAAGVSKGDPIAQVPEWTFNANVEYKFNVASRDGYLFLSYSWVDSSISVNQGRSMPRVRGAYDLLDARVGMIVGNWDISLFAKNLTNRHANLSDAPSLAAEDPRRPRYAINRPRTIGIDFRTAF